LLTVLGTALYGEKRSAYAWAGVAASMVAIALLV
jgi:drug/metabolite transporter (DMT)-like permease